jgi:hypothetical protein
MPASVKLWVSNSISAAFRKVNVPKEIQHQLREELTETLTTTVEKYIRCEEYDIKRREESIRKVEDAVDVLRKYLSFTPKQYL